ncbi:MAG: neutral/alkaline non-lysosomal ceramidase N-terminal domain-containing protein [Oceanococcaceae bacterium]
MIGLSACTGGREAATSASAQAAPEALQCIADHPFVTQFDGLIQDQSRYTYSTFDGDEPPVAPDLFQDAPSAAGLPRPAAIGAVDCAQADRYRVGVARADITGPWAGRSRAGYEAPVNVLTGLSQRVYARAFVIGDTCSGNSTILVNADLGFMHRSLRDSVLQRLADDPATADIDARSVLLTATHTHNFSGGYSYDMMYTGLHLGHKPDVLDAAVEGMVAAIQAAWANAKSAEPGALTLAMNELLHTNANRHPSGYRQNPAEERAEYLDIHGEDQLTNRLVTQLNLYGANDQLKGLLNWFSVHPTASLDGTLGGGDTKGYAAYALEKAINGSAGGEGEADAFVAGFLQSDEGDVIHVRYIDNTIEGEERLPPLVTQALGPQINAQLANVAIGGIRQAANAAALLQADQHRVHGSIDYRMRYVDFSDQTVNDPVVLASLPHPPELDSEPKRTCDPLYGMSSVGKEVFGKYQTCEDGLNVPVEEFLADLNAGNVQRSFGDAAKVALCALSGLDLSPVNGADYSCQAEKGYFLGLGDKGPVITQVRLPLQLLRIGNFAVVSLPWEITTMAGRRIRETVLAEMRRIGVDYVVIAGLSNEYVGYLTTREEYARQGYEASSNQFGPWTLAVVQQELRNMALSMVNATTPTAADAIDPGTPILPNLVGLDPFLLDLPLRGAFTTPIDDVRDSYAAGEYLRFSYQAGHPNNNTYPDAHYFEIERQAADGSWQTWASDADPETVLHWQSSAQDQYLPAIDSVLEVDWFISYDTPPGVYRIVYRTSARTLPVVGGLTEYEAVSRSFQVHNDAPSCAWGAPR